MTLTSKTFLQVRRSRVSFLTDLRTGQERRPLQTLQADGNPLNFFLKVNAHSTIHVNSRYTVPPKITRTRVGKINLEGEFASISASAHAHSRSGPDANRCRHHMRATVMSHFYLASFVDMTDDCPGCRITISQSRRDALEGDFTQRQIWDFGAYHMGACTQQNEWTSSWEKSFTTMHEHYVSI